MSAPISPQSLEEAIDRCVKCGLCLPECPTYRLSSNENESPRGRLALVDGWLSGRLPADESMQAYLDRCLGCRRCERVCPSAVPYGAILDASRAAMAAQGNARAPSSLNRLLNRPLLLRQGLSLAHRLPLGMSRPWPALQRLHRVATALPASTKAPEPGTYAALARERRGRLGLFTGCVTAVQQAAALHASLRLLQLAGFDVLVPDRAICCGALARHDGDTQQADDLAAIHSEVFDGQVEGIVSIASGCGVVLEETSVGGGFTHYDVCQFLVEHGGLTSEWFKPLPATAFVHVPCTVENVYRGREWAPALLRLIPGLKVLLINEPGSCCGSAGDYMLRYPDTASTLRTPVIEQITAQADTATAAVALVTSNVGCALHLAVGLEDAGSSLPVRHPVELLAQQVRDT